MYIYATEMVSEYYGRLGLKNKRVLSVIGSGDQIINAYFFGAKEVVGFDINKYAPFILELKVSAILNLTLIEFFKFFGRDMSSGTLDVNLYKKIKKDLSSGARGFFNRIYKDCDYKGKKLINSDYFRQRSMMKASAVDINIYLKSKKDYLKCREIIRNRHLQSLELDINDILKSRKLTGKFDIINLSNVLNYLTGNTEKDKILKVLANTTKNVSKRLKRGGRIF
jgi:S-adenosylmethionine:diacylglycerol 3-amino-3-carboxypropyl transferase